MSEERYNLINQELLEELKKREGDVIDFELEEKRSFGRVKRRSLQLKTLGSSGGGRITIFCLVPKAKKYSWFSDRLYKIERWLDRHNHKMELLRTLGSLFGILSFIILAKMNGWL